MNLNSIIFHTDNIEGLRNFYEDFLGFKTGSYFKDGVEYPDFDETYVNYHLDNGLLCFEKDDGRLDLGTIVIDQVDLQGISKLIEQHSLELIRKGEFFLIIKDPDGRSIIFEQQKS